MRDVRPLIGLSTYRERARWGVWDQGADLLPTSYALSIERAGGVPVLLPPTTPYADAATAVVARLDALVVAGGADVDPARYDEEPHPATGVPRPDRDAWELALLAAAEARGLPTLGVCRGMQVMAVGSGGSLVQHVPDELGHRRHDPGGDAFGQVEVSIEPGSRLAQVLGPRAQDLVVGCHHHQSVRTHPGWTAVARADDGSLEAIEQPGGRFAVGVQWHPEVAEDAGLFRALVEAAAAGRG
ncbi:gamma-glutamyl-gamma-aminobutyrate hydrolase family protein [Nocardioides korecus]